MNTSPHPTHKPQDYNSVSPYIMVSDAQAFIDFLAAAFDGVPLRRMDMPDGSVAHAEVKIDDTVIMFAQASAEYPAFPAWLHVYVPDVDETYRRALAAGGRSVQEPVQAGDPDKRSGVVDPSGNTWWIATQVD